jgi:phage tail-like protein
MAEDNSSYYPNPASYYALFEMGKDDPLAYFDSLTGGDQTIEMVTYNVMDTQSNQVTTKFMPGQTTFAPLTLLRAMDFYSEEMKNRFADSILGKLKKVRLNYSVKMFDGDGKAIVWWNIFNAIPTKISGFSFNSKTESSYTSFELTLQAEFIEIIFEK